MQSQIFQKMENVCIICKSSEDLLSIRKRGKFNEELFERICAGCKKCVYCGNQDVLLNQNNKQICSDCSRDIRRFFNNLSKRSKGEKEEKDRKVSEFNTK